MTLRSTKLRGPLMTTEYLIAVAMGIGAALMLIIPNDLYDRSSSVRVFADAWTNALPSIGEFARVSNVPGTTRVALATLWSLVLPAAVGLGFSRKTFRRSAYELRQFG